MSCNNEFSGEKRRPVDALRTGANEPAYIHGYECQRVASDFTEWRMGTGALEECPCEREPYCTKGVLVPSFCGAMNKVSAAKLSGLTLPGVGQSARGLVGVVSRAVILCVCDVRVSPIRGTETREK